MAQHCAPGSRLVNLQVAMRLGLQVAMRLGLQVAMRLGLGLPLGAGCEWVSCVIALLFGSR